MKNKFEKLDKIRERELDVSLPSSILSTILVLIFGVIVGAVAQTFEYFAANSSVWWQDIVKDLQLNVIFEKPPIWFMLGLLVAVSSSRPIKAAINELAFFIGVIAGFFVVPMVFSEASKPDNLSTWIIIAVVSVPLAMIFWYAKSNSWPSIAFDALIIGVFGAYCFDCGFVYFHFNDIIMDLVNAVIIALTVVALGSGVIQVCVSLIVGIVIALALGPVI